MILRIADCLKININNLFQLAAQSDESPNVIIVDDSKLILSDALAVLGEVMPEATITGFIWPLEAIEYANWRCGQVNSILDFYNSITCAALALSALGLQFTAKMPGIDKWSKRFFMIFFTSILMSCLFGLIEMILYSYSVSIDIITLAGVIGTLLLSLPLSMPITYCCGENLRSSKLFYTVLCLWSVFSVLLTTAMFSDFFTI